MATVKDRSQNNPFTDTAISAEAPLLKQVGWRDQLGEINVRGSGATDPAWSQIGATNFYAYNFANGANIKQFWHFCHVQHDYNRGSLIYPHIHWIPSTNGTGNVKWNISWTAALGHNQGAFSFASPTTITIVQAAPAIQYQHMIAEVADADAIDVSNMEPDTVICFRVWRDPTDVADTYAADVFSNYFDIHYQIDRFATNNKSPDFYA